jgi:hypothetical protein
MRLHPDVDRLTAGAVALAFIVCTLGMLLAAAVAAGLVPDPFIAFLTRSIAP